jgi:glycosyltransferase involved in cell wall biosynthesis
MHKSKHNSFVRILTDIEIRQSPLWCERTRLVGNTNLHHKFINRLPIKIRQNLFVLFKLIEILRYHHKYDVVISADMAGQLFALYRGIFGIKTPKHIILELMLDEEQKDLKWKIKKMIQKVMFSCVDLVFVSSMGEIATYSDRFKIPEERFRFLPFHTNVIEPKIMSHSDNYILSAGRTGRDYSTLADAVRNIKEKVVIVSGRGDVKGIVFPSNVEVLVDIPYQEYLDLLYKALVVVVPLKKLVKSTGQAAILEAMAVGKPVIATRTTGTADYIQSGVNGILVPVGNSEALKGAINSIINNKSLYKTLSVNALELVKENHTFDIYVGRVLKAAEEMVKRDS